MATHARGKHANVRNRQHIIIMFTNNARRAIEIGNGTLTTIKRTKYIQSQKEWASCT